MAPTPGAVSPVDVGDRVVAGVRVDGEIAFGSSEQLVRCFSAARRTEDIDGVHLREERPNEGALWARLRPATRLVGLDVRVGANLGKRGFPQRRADVGGKQ